MVEGVQTIQAGVVRLNVCFLDSTVFNNQSIALGTVTPEDGCAVEGEIECLCEAKAGISKESNLQMSIRHALVRGQKRTHPTGARWVEHLAPCFHTRYDQSRDTGDFERRHLHERVIHRDDKDLAGIFQLGGVDVTWDMFLGARGREGCRNTCANCQMHVHSRNARRHVYR
jgi:hypothetical protein